ncbi:hypothetical protein [Fodinibius sediminis]|uniref:Uncharacterized protein n=1 Tax=Fodinibius sediminis TaxID=1214077 RepID=A0A521CL59_9BACT|nr:hypothetical protein [Fodinibius sediminis]SMO59461.1 hypothetical protein SAMN06265218_106117 [Fodinibius sediminis]
METRGLGSFVPTREKGPEPSARKPHGHTPSSKTDRRTPELSKRRTITLNLYEGSGSLRTEQPDARGRNIDITV